MQHQSVGNKGLDVIGAVQPKNHTRHADKNQARDIRGVNIRAALSMKNSSNVFFLIALVVTKNPESTKNMTTPKS